MSAPPFESLKACLLDLSQPIAKRTHAAFYLRTNGSLDAMKVIGDALLNRSDSSLMRHELAYILGQMQLKEAYPYLSEVLDEETEDVLVRHESAEALGAIGDSSFLDILDKYRSHHEPDIAETCQIAVDLITWKIEKSQSEAVSKGIYYSVDPAPPEPGVQSLEILELNLLDTSKSLFDRYRAMFSLRNLNSDEAALVLVKGFSDESALFRHEVAYVLGQMCRFVTVEGLESVLRNKQEHRMVNISCHIPSSVA